MNNIETIIVTGGLGFIGKNFCNELSIDYKNKIILDKITYASDLDFYYSVLKDLGWKLIVDDLNSDKIADCFEALTKVQVVHFAAESHVDNSFKNAGDFLISNTMGTQSLIDLCLRFNFRLLHISTDEVYGESILSHVKESSPLTPTNPYAATKAAADIFVQTHIKCFGLDAKIIRANNIFGSRQLCEKVIPKAIKSASCKNEFLLHGDKPIKRHFLHTSDFTLALERLLTTWEVTAETIFNIAGDKNITIRELIEFIYEELSANSQLIKYGPDRPFNDQEYNIDDSLIRSLGWKPVADFWKELALLCSNRSFIERQF